MFGFISQQADALVFLYAFSVSFSAKKAILFLSRSLERSFHL